MGCLELLPEIPDKSIDMILTDLPYGTTACSWDTPIDLTKLWPEYRRIIKDNGIIVLTASQPFTSVLVMSNIEMFKYCWVWEKDQGTDFFMADVKPLKNFEDILIFYNSKPTYNPQYKITRSKWVKRDTGNSFNQIIDSKEKQFDKKSNGYNRYPLSIIYFKRPKQNGIHPTQKPVALFEYLIKTYTNEGDTVHDSCLGSGTTLEACLNTNRNCIGFEISDEWVPHYKKRLRTDNSKLTDDW